MERNHYHHISQTKNTRRKIQKHNRTTRKYSQQQKQILQNAHDFYKEHTVLLQDVYNQRHKRYRQSSDGFKRRLTESFSSNR